LTLNIKSSETDRLARELCALTGETITEAVTRALEERLQRQRSDRNQARELARAAAIDAIFERAAVIPATDRRSDDELLGYDESGTFE
jgi:antitoxin VapB